MTVSAIERQLNRVAIADAWHTHEVRPAMRRSALRCRWRTERGRWRALRADGRWWDEIILHRLLATATALIWYGYTYPRGFILAHLLGPVSRVEHQRRLAYCSECPYRVVDRGRAYCVGDHGGRGCGCWRSRWWPMSQLGWMTGLAHRPCPAGRFGRASGVAVGRIVAVAKWFRRRFDVRSMPLRSR